MSKLNHRTITSQLSNCAVLYIPVHLIWKIKVRWTQKAALTISLCLTVIMVVLTITRVCGIKIGGTIDTTWETYWLILSAEIGIVLTSTAAFRAFFVSRVKRKRDKGIQPAPNTTQWYHQRKRILKRILTTSQWRLHSRVQASSEGHKANEDDELPMNKLPEIPRAHITGVRTYIRGQDMMMNASSIMQSQTTQGVGDTWSVHTQKREFGSLV